MKKLLYGTTALAAVGLMVGSANAADKIKMGVGGYFQGFMVYGSQDDGTGEAAAGRRSTAVQQESEIIFNGSTTLDNGIQFGVQVQLEGETCGDQIDESFMWASGSFGRINLGSENSAAYLMHYAAPAPSGWSHGLNSPNFSHATTGGATNFPHTNPVSLTSDDEKITYFTPRMAGFQLGVSYTPDTNIEDANGGDALSTGSYGGLPADTDNFGETYEIGANYVNKFNGVDVALSGSYGQAKDDVNTAGVTDDRKEWSVGGQVSMAGFTVGAGYRQDNLGTDGSNTDREDYNVGVRYATGPWGVGVEYAHVTIERGAGLGEDEVDAFEVGGSYDLGPGVQLQAGVQWWSADDNLNVAANEGDSTIVFVGTFLSF
jgi:predicted porin